MNKINGIICTCATVIALYTMSIECLAVETKDEEQYKAIEYVKEHCIMNGYTDGSFRENEEITNCEFLVVLARAFSDIDKENTELNSENMNWYDKYVDYIGSLELYNTSIYYDMTHDELNESLSIGTLAKGLVNILDLDVYNYKLYDNHIKELDCEIYTNYYTSRDYIELMHQMGLIDSDIDLNEPITRGEVADIVYKVRVNEDIPNREYRPKYLDELKVNYLDSSEMHRYYCEEAIGEIPTFILQSLIDNNWTINFTEDNIWNYYESPYHSSSIAIDGIYIPALKEIYVSFKLVYSIENTLLHEIGHYVYYEFLDSADRLEIQEIYNKEKGSMEEYSRKYNSSNEKEYFADGFRLTVQNMYRDTDEKSHPINNIPLVYNKILDTIQSNENSIDCEESVS